MRLLARAYWAGPGPRTRGPGSWTLRDGRAMNWPRASETDLEPRSRWPIRFPAGRGGEPSRGSCRGSYLTMKTPASSGRSLPEDSSSTCITRGAGFGRMALGAGNTIQPIAWRPRQGGKASQLRGVAVSWWPPGHPGAKPAGDPPRSCAARGELGRPCAAPHPRPRLGLPCVRLHQCPQGWRELPGRGAAGRRQQRWL